MRMARIQTLVTPNAGDSVEHQELSFTAGGNAKWDNPFGRHIVAASYKAKHTLTL